MKLMKKIEAKFGDFKIIGIVSLAAMLILMFVLNTYIKYLNIGGESYGYLSILKGSYIQEYKDENFNKSKEIFLNDIKDYLGINIGNPISIVSKEFYVMDSTDVDEKKLSINISDDLNKDLEENKSVSNRLDNKTEKGKILIYHTHTTEAFKPSKPESFYEEYNIVGVGDVLKTELEKNYNVEVIHDKTIHSTSYLESYKRSGETLEKYLAEIDDFDLIIDLHRDAHENKSLVTTQIDGKDVARIMFVVARNNPNYLENEELAIDLTMLANDLYPTIARNIFYYEKGSSAFNQTKSSKLVLIEMGSHLNTIEEVFNSAKLLANVIGEYITASKT